MTLLQGDCLNVLPHDWKANLIYIDPPYNSGRDYKEFDDRFKSMDTYIEWLRERVEVCWDALSDTGSFYLHCDPTSSHYIKVMLDGVFGIKNFRNEIVWRIGWISGFKSQKKGWIRNHDTILYYRKSANGVFNKNYIPYPTGYVRRDGKKPVGKGIPIEDTWNCSQGDKLDSIQIQSFITKQYPTQKPVKLLERIIKASSNEGDLVLDPMCGSGTALVAAKKLNRQYVGIDQNENALHIAAKRLQGVEVPLL